MWAQNEGKKRAFVLVKEHPDLMGVVAQSADPKNKIFLGALSGGQKWGRG